MKQISFLFFKIFQFSTGETNPPNAPASTHDTNAFITPGISEEIPLFINNEAVKSIKKYTRPNNVPQISLFLFSFLANMYPPTNVDKAYVIIIPTVICQFEKPNLYNPNDKIRSITPVIKYEIVKIFAAFNNFEAIISSTPETFSVL